MLAELQQQLNDTNGTDAGYDVRDFLITDLELARALGGASMLAQTGETLLVHEDDDGLSLSLYLEAEILSRLESGNPLAELREHQLDDLCKVIEGLSHFNYVAWRAGQDRSMSLLELELQGEVDKFVSTLRIAHDQRDAELSRMLHTRLFDNVRFHEELDEEQAERYRRANDLAARFCRGLRARIEQNRDGAMTELRRFYRLPLREKISHIHAHAFATN